MKPFTKIASLFLGVIALFHLLRLIFQWKVIFINYELPLWLSILGFVIASVLSIRLWKEAKVK